MIDINLIPQELRKQRKNKLLGKINIPLEILVGCFGGFVIILGMIHVVILLLNVGKVAHLKTLQYQWESMETEKKNVESIKSEMNIFKGKFKALEDIAKKGEMSWAQKLNILSDELPRGMWFKKIALAERMLFIEGSTISQDASEIASVSRLIASLKNDEEFIVDFTEIELGSINRRRIKNVEIADFVITMKLQ